MATTETDEEFVASINTRRAKGETTLDSTTDDMMALLGEVKETPNSAGYVTDNPPSPPSSLKGIAPELSSAEDVQVGSTVFDIKTYKVGTVTEIPESGFPSIHWDGVNANPIGSVAFGTNTFHLHVDFTVR